jgi:arylsulfatase A-like enzyme
LIVIDTLRSDHLGAYGYERPTSPTFDALAAQGTLFSNATAPSSWTRPSMASLFTSRAPSEHGAVSSLALLHSELTTLAELLLDGGYRTLGVSGNFPHINDKSGLTRGFETFVSLALPARESDGDPLMRLTLREGAKPVPLRAPTAAEVNERVTRLLPSRDERPLFLYVHYMDPHSGYLAPEAFRARFRTPKPSAAERPTATSDYLVELTAGRVEPPPGERERLIDLYDAEIAYVDWQLGRLLEDLEESGLMDDAVVVVLSDHGEEFADHGSWFHGLTLHREVLRVPLVIRGAAGLEVGTRDDPVDLLDVPTTLLSLAGLMPAEGMRGQVLSRRGERSAPRIAELHPDALREEKVGALRHQVALDVWPWKVVVGRSGEISLYHLGDDPAEQRPLPAGHPLVPASLIALARERVRAMESASGPAEAAISEEERAALRALGYAE